jgi:hypothetical protein
MSTFTWAMFLKPIIAAAIIFGLYRIVPAGKIKTALFRERPWNIWAWLVGMSFVWFLLGWAIWDLLTGR